MRGALVAIQIGMSGEFLSYQTWNQLRSSPYIENAIYFSFSRNGRFLLRSFDTCTHFVIMVASYPEVQGGGSLILAWQIKNKNVLVVGGGEVSSPRISARDVFADIAE